MDILPVLRIMPSDETFEIVNNLSYLIAVYKNPQLFYDVVTDGISDPSRFVEIETMESLMEELMH